MDFEPLARDALPPAHFGYIATGADDDRTVVRNHEAFSHYEIRAHRFNDVSKISLATQVFGVAWPSPVYLSAVSAMRAFHPDAEVGVARAARARSTHMMLSSGSSSATEDVIAARGAPIWQQLYPTDDWEVTEKIVRRAENGRLHRHCADRGFTRRAQSRDAQAAHADRQSPLRGTAIHPNRASPGDARRCSPASTCRTSPRLRLRTSRLPTSRNCAPS